MNIGEIYLDKDNRMSKRALRIVAIDAKVICEVGSIMNQMFIPFMYHNRARISEHRLGNPSKFIFWSE